MLTLERYCLLTSRPLCRCLTPTGSIADSIAATTSLQIHMTFYKVRCNFCTLDLQYLAHRCKMIPVEFAHDIFSIISDAWLYIPLKSWNDEVLSETKPCRLLNMHTHSNTRRSHDNILNYDDNIPLPANTFQRVGGSHSILVVVGLIFLKCVSAYAMIYIFHGAQENKINL